MVLDSLTESKINIKDLVIPSVEPERRIFDPRIDISPETKVNILNALEGVIMDNFLFGEAAICAKLCWPEEFKKHKDKILEFTKLMLKDQLSYDLLFLSGENVGVQYHEAVWARIMFPGEFDEMFTDRDKHWEIISKAMERTDPRTSEGKYWNDYMYFAAAAKVLFPEKFNISLDKESWDGITKEANESNIVNVNNMTYLYCFARLAFPEDFEKYITRDWAVLHSAKKYLSQFESESGESGISYASYLLRLEECLVALAGKVKVTKDAVKITFDEDEEESKTRSLPETRKY